MKSRDRLLNNIEAGDFVFAVANDGAPKILLVYRTTKVRIFARLITSQTKIELGRDGKSKSVAGDYTCEIISVRPLPPHAYAIARGLDRKMRLGQFPNGFLLSRAEQQFLQKTETYYREHLLNAADDPMRFPDEGATPASFDVGPPAVD